MLRKISLVLAATGIILLIILWPKISLYLAANKKSINTKKVNIFFDANSGLEGLSKKLFEKQIIDDPDAFMRVATYKKLTASRLASGKYLILSGTKYKRLLNGFTKNALGNGNAEIEVKVVFSNARDIYQMAQQVAKCLQLDSNTIVDYVLQDSILKDVQLSEEELPALFLPNTYRMFWDTDVKGFFKRMQDEYNNFWTNERREKLKVLGLRSTVEAVTLASIVYAEQAKNKSEWPTIAGLYYNRIKQGMKLQSDPTFRFCWGRELDGVQRLTYAHRERNCPYNTYLYYGLPPGPICIPPRGVVDAVLNLEKHKYIYMVAKPNYSGLHDFSDNYATHMAYARNYSKWLKQEGIR